MDKFPKPYANSVPKNPEAVSQLEYTHFPTLGIGARPSGLPKGDVNAIKSLEHVGDSATKGK